MLAQDARKDLCFDIGRPAARDIDSNICAAALLLHGVGDASPKQWLYNGKSHHLVFRLPITLLILADFPLDRPR